MRSRFNPFWQIALLALMIGWYQLPVMVDRTQHLANEDLSLSLMAILEPIDATVGAPARALRQWAEARKLALAVALANASDFATLPEPVSTPGTALAAVAASSPLMPAPASGPEVATVTGQTGPTEAPENPVTDRSAAFAPTHPTPATAAAESPTQPVLGGPALSPSEYTGDLKVPGGRQTLLLAGDSVMGELAYGFKRWALKHPNWTIVDGHKVSSGLCNSSYYDWPQVLASLVDAHQPNAIAFLVGANDVQDIFLDKKRYKFGTSEWLSVYKERVAAIAATAKGAKADLYWVVPPIMESPTLERNLKTIRGAIQDALNEARASVHIVDRSSYFVDKEGHYAKTALVKGKPRELRTPDGIHLSYLGADILMNGVLEELHKKGTQTASPAEPSTPGAVAEPTTPASGATAH